MENKPNYYSIIPASVRYDEELKANEKLLYGEITALANKNGYCWAENQYFAKLFAVTKETASRWVSNLEKQGYVRTELIRGAGKEIKERRIYIQDPLLTKNAIPYKQKTQYPIDEKRKEELNNTSINNTRVNKDHSPAEPDTPPAPHKKIIGYLNQVTGKSYKHQATKNRDLIKARWNEGYRYPDFETVIDNKAAQWLGDPKMKEYLRPVTLFGNKFDTYLNEVPKKPKGGHDLSEYEQFL